VPPTASEAEVKMTVSRGSKTCSRRRLPTFSGAERRTASAERAIWLNQ